MSTNPQISVIIPVYNAEKTLNRCLNSIIAQDFKDFEVLLVDDGSTDDSGKICDEYAAKDDRFKVFHKKNGGASSARNIGLDNAKGEYITFCDADDYTEANWLDVFISNIKDYDIVVSSFNQIEKKISNKRVFSYDVHNVDLVWALLKLDGGPGFLWNKCFKNEIIKGKKIRFNESYKIWEDEEFVSHYFMFAKSAKLDPRITYNYYESNINIKYRNSQNIKALFDIFNHLLSFIALDGGLKIIYSLYITNMLNCIRAYYYQKKYASAYKALLRVCSIIKETRINGLPRIEKIFSKKHPLLTHFSFMLLSVTRKL